MPSWLVLELDLRQLLRALRRFGLACGVAVSGAGAGGSSEPFERTIGAAIRPATSSTAATGSSRRARRSFQSSRKKF